MGHSTGPGGGLVMWNGGRRFGGTAVPHIRRHSVPSLTGLCEAAYVRQGHNLTIFFIFFYILKLFFIKLCHKFVYEKVL